MTKTSRIVFFGNERLATGVSTSAPTLTALISAGYDICAVVANYERGTSRSAQSLEVAEVAERYGIPVLLPEKPTDIEQELIDMRADAGVLAAYGRIVPQSVIDIFPNGIINVHPSLLPLHRGPTPLESVILNGEPKTGVSIMRLVKAMDAGPVYGQSEYELSGSETKQELSDTLGDIGAAMVTELLPGILNGSVVPAMQDDSAATYDNLIKKQDGTIDWQKPAQQIEREVRAYAKWPKSRTSLDNIDVIITSGKATKLSDKFEPGKIMAEKKRLFVGTGKDWLEISALQLPGKPEMTAEAFLAGYSKRLA